MLTYSERRLIVSNMYFRYCQDHHADGHDTHGLHALSDYDLDAFNLRDLTSDHGHRQRSGNGHSHDHDHGYGTSHSHHHSHDHGHGHDHESNHDHESTDSADSNEETSNSQEGAGQQSFRSPAQVAPGRGLALIPGREPVSTVPVVPVDPWMYGKCDLKPNVDVPESAVRGSITISQLVRIRSSLLRLSDLLIYELQENYKINKG